MSSGEAGIEGDGTPRTGGPLIKCGFACGLYDGLAIIDRLLGCMLGRQGLCGSREIRYRTLALRRGFCRRYS